MIRVTDAAPVLRYADRFHRALPPGHQVASPLGAWLLLALVPPSAGLTDVLGTDDAAVTARSLLEHPHPLVGAAAALWTAVDSDALRAWRDGLPAPVERGPVPSQRDADAWARRGTLDLIDAFPLELKPDTALVLATALATKVSWAVPFELAPAAQLRSTAWPALTQVLRTDGRHDLYLAPTPDGPVAVHEAYADGGLRVRSVIADPSVPALDVLALAHRPLDRLALADLPLGDGAVWTSRIRRSGWWPPRRRWPRCCRPTTTPGTRRSRPWHGTAGSASKRPPSRRWPCAPRR